MQDTNEMRDRLINEFVENYTEKLFYFCLKKTGSHIETEDLTQEIALQIITALNKGTIPTSFSAWVWQIARNHYSVWAKEKHNRNESVTGSDIGDYEIEDERENILDEMIHTEQMALLRRELAFIKSDYRNIVVAYYIENKNVREIAESLSLSTNTVKSRLLRAREILKEGMDMAREFGKRSYNPENIAFWVNGLHGANGEPGIYVSRSLNKNIMLAAYRTPAAAEELAMEVGVALPYMEEELSTLVDATLMKKNGNKYETNIFIVSAEAQEKICAHVRGIAPELTKAIIDTMEYNIEWSNKNAPNWHEGYQSYEDMKWALLMIEADNVSFDTLKPFIKTPKMFLILVHGDILSVLMVANGICLVWKSITAMSPNMWVLADVFHAPTKRICPKLCSVNSASSIAELKIAHHRFLPMRTGKQWLRLPRARAQILISLF